MQRKARHQTGTVFQRKREGRLAWFGQYKDAMGQRQTDHLPGVKTKSEAKSALAAILVPINQKRAANSHDPDITLATYIEIKYLPYGLKKWKGSTITDTPSRIRKHLVNGELGAIPIAKLDRETMQSFLYGMAGMSASLVSHLRFDLRKILTLAKSDRYITENQAAVLYTPRACRKTSALPSLTLAQVHDAFAVLGLRERLFCRIAIFSGLRPGEIVALKWSSIEGNVATVAERIYKGVTDKPKNDRVRDAILSEQTLHELMLWRQYSGDSEYVFPAEGGATAVWYANLWARIIQPRFKKIGLEWADFRCMRRTNANLMKASGADVKVGADQRGHNVGVSINEYTESTPEQKSKAVAELERMFMLSPAPTGEAGLISTLATGARS